MESINVQQCRKCGKWHKEFAGKYCDDCKKSTIPELQRELTKAINDKDPLKTLKINAELKILMGIEKESKKTKEDTPLLDYINT